MAASDVVIDLEMARVFLATLDFEGRLDAPNAFQSIPDIVAPTQRQKWDLTRGGDGHPEMTGPLDAVAPHLERLHALGAGIHVAVNQTDASGGRKNENVVALRALCADWDHGTFYARDGYTVPQNGVATGPEPSIVVRTPRGVHWYWLLHAFDGEDFDAYKTRWKQAQKAISRQYQADENVCILAGTLRLPGSWHQKQRPVDAESHAAIVAEITQRIDDGALTLAKGSAAMARLAREEYTARGGTFAPIQKVELERCDPVRYELGHLVRGLGLQIQTRPKVHAPRVEHHDIEARLRRCRAMMDHVPPSVESRYGGDGNAWSYTRGVCGIGGDFGLEPDEFLPLLSEWNARCVPPWDENDLWDKLVACHQARNDPFGWRLEQESDEHRRRREAWEGRMTAEREGEWSASLTAPEGKAPLALIKREGPMPPEPPFPVGASSGGGDDDGPPPSSPPSSAPAPRRSDDSRAPELWRLDSVEVGAKGPDQITMSNLGNSERFVDRYGDLVRYVKSFDRWYVWDGTRWCQDVDAEESHVAAPAPAGVDLEHYIEAARANPFHSGNYVVELAKRVARSMHGLTKSIHVVERDDKGKKVYASDGKPKIDQGRTFEKRKKWVEHVVRTESEGGLRQILNLSKSDRDIARFPSYFDPYAYMINTHRGVLDMRTGVYYPHHPSFSQSKMSRLHPQRSGCPTWTKFLERVLGGDDEMIRFVQRAVGYSLTGETREQVLFLLYGTGKNGKSTFLNVLHGLAGEYAQHAEFSTFVERQNEVVRNDLARLHKARLVTAVEPKSTGYLDEAVIKQVTGQDVVTARFLFHEHFEYVPQFKIWLASNHKPMIRGNDEGIWRRILMLPFTVRIPEEEKDPDLPRKLAAELPAIFAWATDGAKIWYEQGLNAPDAVRQATQDYRDEMDSIGLFLAMRCVLMENVRAGATSLYRHYVKWSEAVGEHPLSQKKFGMRLEERGLHKHRTARGYEYDGVAVRDDEALEQPVSARPYKDD